MPLLFKAVRLEIILVYLLSEAERATAILRLNQALKAGALSFDIEKVYAVSEACRAHEAVEAGNRQGAILIQIGESAVP